MSKRHAELVFRDRRRWILLPPVDGVAFLTWIRGTVTQDAVLYFEGVGIRKEAAAAYRSHAAGKTRPVMKNTFSPRPRSFHVKSTTEALAQIVDLVKSYGPASLCEHFHVYRGDRMLIYWHDAFTDNRVLLSGEFAPASIERLRKLTECAVEWDDQDTEANKPVQINAVDARRKAGAVIGIPHSPRRV